MAYQLPPLPYSFDALEPHIDARTMELHHDKHHQSYVNKVNDALDGVTAMQGKSIEEVLRNINDVPEEKRQAVINHGGGHANHTLFWQIMGPNGGGAPAGDLADAINGVFGSFDNFKDTFSKAAAGQFGSGWAWLVVKNGKLACYSSANQDSPITQGDIPVLTLDVWEHAYYLNYQNRRPDYIQAWWNTVNWTKVGELFLAAQQ